MQKSARALSSEPNRTEQGESFTVNDLLTNQMQLDKNFATAEEVHQELDSNTDLEFSHSSKNSNNKK